MSSYTLEVSPCEKACETTFENIIHYYYLLQCAYIRLYYHYASR